MAAFVMNPQVFVMARGRGTGLAGNYNLGRDSQ